MNNDMTNEILCEKLFGLEKIKTSKSIKSLDGSEYVYSGSGEFHHSLPNYIMNYQQVLERLMRLTDSRFQNLLLEYDPENRLFFAEVMQPFDEIEPIFCRGEGYTLGEAICKSAVEFLKNSKTELL